jgi:hypothetical protein
MKQKYINNKFLDFFLSLDAMGPSITLNFDGKENYRTGFGTLFTFTTLIICIFTISGTIDSVINKTNPNVYSSTTYDDQPLSLNNTSLKFYITVLTLDLTTFTFTPIDKSEFQLNPIYNQVKENRTGTYLISNSTPLVDCGESIFKDFNSGFISEKEYLNPDAVEDIRRNAYCLPDVNYTIGSNLQEQIMFNIGFLSGLYKHAFKKYPYIVVQFTYKTVLLNPDNFTHYYDYVWKGNYFLLKKDRMDFFEFNIENYQLKKDQTMFIFSDEVETNLVNGIDFVQIASVDDVLGDQYSYLSITFNKSNRSTKTDIRYKSLNDVISDFGGSFGALFPLFQFILKLIVVRIYNFLVLDDVIKLYEPQNENYKHKFKNFVLQGDKIIINKDRLDESLPEKLDKSVDKSHKLNINHFINSFDKQGGVFVFRYSETRGEFIKNSTAIISANKKISINDTLKSSFICAKKSKKAQNLKKIADKCRDLLEDTLNISSIFSSTILFKKLMKILFTKEEFQIISNSSCSINSFKVKDTAGNVNPENQIQYLLELNYKDRRSRKLLKEFINSNF